MLEVLQRAWFTLGFIVFLMSWMWQRAQDPEQEWITRAYRATLLAGAAIAILFLITSR